MNDIQRWGVVDGVPGAVHMEVGPFVTYADHVEALRQAETSLSQRYLLTDKQYQQAEAAAYEQGQRDALAIADRVLPKMWANVLVKQVTHAAEKGEQA